MSSLQTNHPGMYRLLVTVVIAAFVVFVFRVSFASMWDLWQTTDHRHGLLVFPISLFLIWQLRHRFEAEPLTADPKGLVLVVLLALLWLTVRLAGIQVLEHATVLAMIPATVITFAGPKFSGKILFPLFFLLLATPIGESLVPYLMVITADLSAGLLKLSGVPFLRSGQYMSLPGGEFVVADVCSGLRYLLTGSMIALLFGYLTYTSVRKRLIFLVATAVTLVVANGVRAYIVMAVASASEMRYLAGRDHVYFGWLMFGVVIMFVMWIGGRYADDRTSLRTAATATAERSNSNAMPLIAALGFVMLALTIMPLMADFGEVGTMLAALGATVLFALALLGGRRKKPASDTGVNVASRAVSHGLSLRHAATAVAALAILIATPRFVLLVEREASDTLRGVNLNSIAACTAGGPWSRSWQPRFHSPDIETTARLNCPGGPVNVYVAAYSSALQGSELISSTHQVVPPEWERVSKSSVYEVPRDVDSLSVVEVRVADTVMPLLVWYWYEVDGRPSTSALMTKFNQLLALLRRRPSGGHIVVIETAAASETDFRDARVRLSRVATAIAGEPARVSSGVQR